MNQIAIASDIEKAFLQVGLHPEERDVTQFLWLKNPGILSTEDNIQIYRFVRVPFGVTSSPFLLAATIQHHLRKDGSPIAQNILNNIYVDNIITGVHTEEQVIQFYHKTKEMFQGASMNVHQWISNSDNLMKSIPPEDGAPGKCKILGIPWDPQTDTFATVVPQPIKAENEITKRSILQFLASFYDPMGYFCPVTLQGKIFLQRVWKERFEWDAPLPAPLGDQWNTIAHDLCLLTDFEYPHFLGHGDAYELHVFTDASQVAYGICVYLRITSPNVSSKLIFAKAHVAPARQTITIPHLELIAVHMGSKVLHFIESALPIAPQRSVLWTDSQCVLHWIELEKPLTVFVRNRVSQIKQNSNVQFRYIGTSENPADMASRSRTAADLTTSPLWWEGPPFLGDSKEDKWLKFDLPQKSESVLSSIASEERQDTVSTVATQDEEGIGSIISYKNFSFLVTAHYSLVFPSSFQVQI